MSTEKDETNKDGDLGMSPSSSPTTNEGGTDKDARGMVAAATTDAALSEEKNSSSQEDGSPMSDPAGEHQRVDNSTPSAALVDVDRGSALVMDPNKDGNHSSDNDDDDDDDADDDEQGPPPLVLERQPSMSAPKQPFERNAPPRTVSSASSQDSSGAAPVLYRSVREIFGSDDPRSGAQVVPVAQLRKLATAGNLDSSHRGVSWRVLLGYLGPDRSLWPDDLHNQRTLYWELCQQTFANPPIEGGADLKQQPRRHRQQPSSSRVSHGMTDDSSRSTSSHHGADDPDARGGGEDDAHESSLTMTTSSAPLVVPQAVRDAWKRSGRDAHVFESVCSGINALRLPEMPGGSGDLSSSTVEEEQLRLACDNFVNTAALLDEIRKDVVRTCSDLSFYLDPVLGTRRYAVLERILLISATLSNRAVRYVQGMNEIVAILYFVLTSRDEEEEDEDEVEQGPDEQRGDETHEEKVVASHVLDGGSSSFSDVALGDEEDKTFDESTTVARREEEETVDWADHAEPDAYWLFHALLSEMSDVFVPDMDSAETGIQGRIAAMQDLLRRHDGETAEHLEEIGIDTGFYAVRWWTTLLSREFRLPDTVRLWDSMFASTHKDNFIRYVCVTMVLIIRDLLLKADFSTCLRMLQSYPPTNMEQLLQSSRALWVYESQLTVACHRGGISLHQALQTIAPPPGVLFAFGLRNGVLQSRDRDIETKTAEVKVREATQAVASQAQVIFGRARGLYSRSMLEYRKYRSASTTSSATSDAKNIGDGGEGRAPVGRSKSQGDLDAHAEHPPDDPDDSIYMEAILKA